MKITNKNSHNKTVTNNTVNLLTFNKTDISHLTDKDYLKCINIAI